MSTIPRITAEEADAAYTAAQKVVEIHRRLAGWLRPGVKLPEIDRYVERQLDDLGCRSCFLRYRAGGGMPPFPSHSCLSVNECVVHGTAASYEPPLREGDVLKVDIGVTHRGWIGDAAWTYVFGAMSPEVKKLTEVGKRSLEIGIQTLRPGRRLLDWAAAVQDYVERDHGLHLVRGLGGHGYGRKLHAPPHVSNTRPRFAGEWNDASVVLEPGVLLAVEPMLAWGTGETVTGPGRWPILTADGSMAVHYEHDVLVTAGGPRVLTEGLESLPDVIPCPA